MTQSKLLIKWQRDKSQKDTKVREPRNHSENNVPTWVSPPSFLPSLSIITKWHTQRHTHTLRALHFLIRGCYGNHIGRVSVSLMSACLAELKYMSARVCWSPDPVLALWITSDVTGSRETDNRGWVRTEEIQGIGPGARCWPPSFSTLLYYKTRWKQKELRTEDGLHPDALLTVIRSERK